MKQKDWDYIARLEKAIQKKYGEEAVANPMINWIDEKEQAYLEQLKEENKKTVQIKSADERVEKDGFFFSKNLITRKNKRNCPVCETYSFKSADDLYMVKFDCCYDCYIQYVIGREERWSGGWRPEHVDKKQKI